MKIILINGPSRSGKDTVQSFIPAYKEKLSYPLKHGVMGMVEPGGAAERMYYYEEHKEEPFRKFAGRPISYRQAQIDLFQAMACIWGDAWLGELLVDRIKGAGLHINEYCNGMVSVSDSGRRGECVPIVEAFGPDNVLLLQISRPNITWSDNRSHVDLSDLGVRCVAISNDGSIDDLKLKTLKAIEGFSY